MILELFALFFVISITLIVIGLAKPEESAAALIGFTFLFLLSLVIMNNNLEYQIGEQRNISYSYLSDNVTIDKTVEDISYNYINYDDTTGFFNTHVSGFYLAIASVIGFIGVLISLKGGWRRE